MERKNAESFGEKLQELIDWSGISRAELARRAGISPGSINGYINSGRKPSAEIAKRMAAGLGVSISTLMGEEPLSLNSLELTDDEGLMLSKFRTLTPHQQELIKMVIETSIRQNEEDVAPNKEVRPE